MVLVFGLAGYIAYDKMFIEKNSNIQDNNSENSDILDIDFVSLFNSAEKLYATPYYYVELDKTEMKTYNRNTYYLVNTQNFKFKNLSEMKNELSKMFTTNIVNNLVYGNALFKECDGKLYRQDGFRKDSYDAADSNIQKIVVNDSLVVLANNVSFRLDGPNNEVRTTKLYYIVSKTENGNWVFENFELL